MDSRSAASLALCIILLLIAGPLLSDSSSRRPDKHSYGSVIKLKRGSPYGSVDPTKVTQLSWHPRAFVYRNFLLDEECDHLIELARDKLEKSMVADNESGKSVESQVRTSSGMFLNKAQDEVVADIERRIASWTFLPIENGESMQVLHYENGQKYEPHFDYFQDKVNQQLGGHRVATVLMYLSNVVKGGETVFPNAMEKLDQPEDENWSDCAKTGNALKPSKGDALLFFSLHLNTTTDPMSLHGSCPVIEGEKWSATKWIQEGHSKIQCFQTSVRMKTITALGGLHSENALRTLHTWSAPTKPWDFVGRVAEYVHLNDDHQSFFSLRRLCY